MELRRLLGFTAGGGKAESVRTEGRWEYDGVAGEELSWSVGYGPRTRAWLLKPLGVTDRLPGVLALHDHGHFKFLGKEKIADRAAGDAHDLAQFRAQYYGGRAFANALAKRGCAVLIPDVFLWGSRRLSLQAMPEFERALAEPIGALLGQEQASREARMYNGAAFLNEHLVAKYCTVLGTSLAAIVAHEDRCALGHLRGRDDVDASRIACVGLSGGGARAALLRATSDDLDGCVIAGMMCTQAEMLSDCIAPHTWMFFPPGLSLLGDWPDLPGAGAPAPLLVQYLDGDAQFSKRGMKNADARIRAHYAAAGADDAYRAEFYAGPHRFDVEMQESAFDWLWNLFS
jgi:dienelactone hydrolase